MIELDLDRIEAVCDAATPGPWVVAPPSEWDRDGEDIPQAGVSQKDGLSITWDDHGGEVFSPADAAFIAETDPDVTKELVRQLRAAQTMLAKVSAISTRLRRDGHHGIADKLDKACNV